MYDLRLRCRRVFPPPQEKEAREASHSADPSIPTAQRPRSHHVHDSPAPSESGRVIPIEQSLLEKNARLAERNRAWLAERRIVAVNILGSPGSGKTTLLERTVRDLHGQFPISVIEGDQETHQDADRLRRTGCRVVQINTGAGCHLEAEMVARGLSTLDPPQNSLLLIENVGNLICPALFDLGEQVKIVLLSVTEGEEKPLKYAPMFREAQVLLVHKVDLLPYLTFDVSQCLTYATNVNPALQVMQLSSTIGQGFPRWLEWIAALMGPRSAGGISPC